MHCIFIQHEQNMFDVSGLAYRFENALAQFKEVVEDLEGRVNKSLRKAERKLLWLGAGIKINRHTPAIYQLSKQQFIRELVLDFYLNQTGHGPGAIGGGIAMAGKPGAGCGRKAELHLFLRKLCIELCNKLVHNF